jgi:hypothetical protein
MSKLLANSFFRMLLIAPHGVRAQTEEAAQAIGGAAAP